MLKTQFDYLCKSYGDQSIDESERWKAIRYIYNENPILDVQYALKHNTILYIDNKDIGPGFYILEAPLPFSIPKKEDKVITFIPLYAIDKISLVTDYVNQSISNLNINKNSENNDIYEELSIYDKDETSVSTIIE